MTNFILSLTTREKTVNLSIKNEMGQDCYIPESSIMLDGFKSDKFQITYQSGENIMYQGIQVKYYPELVLLKNQETLSSKLDLSDAYLFTLSGEYSVYYSSYIDCCEDIEGKDCSSPELIEAATSTIINDTCINILNTGLSSPEKIAILLTSKLFKSLNPVRQGCLIGEDLLANLQECLLPPEQEPYDLGCIGKVMIEMSSVE